MNDKSNWLTKWNEFLRKKKEPKQSMSMNETN